MSGVIRQFLPLINELVSQGKNRKEVVEAVLKEFSSANPQTISTQFYKVQKSKVTEVKGTTTVVEEKDRSKSSKRPIITEEDERKKVIIDQILSLAPDHPDLSINYYNFTEEQLKFHLSKLQSKNIKVIGKEA